MSRRAAISVIAPGMLSTIQDLGRAGWSHTGVGRGGAADTLSLRVGNRLVGNDDGAAAIEMTWTGGTLEFRCDAVVAMTGLAIDARHERRGESTTIESAKPIRVEAGDRIVIGPIQTGARAYLCVGGGIDCPLVLGSRSTHLIGAFGGMDGRALRAGDVLDIGGVREFEEPAEMTVRARRFLNDALTRRTVRTVNGAQSQHFDASFVESFWATSYEVSMHSDRAGLRLTGGSGPTATGGRMPSEGMMPGAVQVPESGEPIVLLCDHPTTGGYPVIACVAAVDHPALGQIRPGERLQFERVSVAEARALYLAQEQALNAAIPPAVSRK